jgi:hypothetical protein
MWIRVDSSERSAACYGVTAKTTEPPAMDRDLVILARIVSACTLGLWAFAGGLLIGVFLF